MSHEKRTIWQKIKYFIGFDDYDVIRPLCVKVPQMIG